MLLGVSDAFESLGSSLVNNIDRLLLLATCAILSLLFLTIQPDIVEWGLTVRQCLVMPNVQAYIWPLLNLARLLYSSVIPLVGMGTPPSWAERPRTTVSKKKRNVCR